MAHQTPTPIVKPFIVTFIVMFLGLSYFAIYPAIKQGEAMTLVVTLTWMLMLAGIVTTYAIAVVCLAADDEPTT